MSTLTDEEFRAKLEKHFSLYRINLRSPIASQVALNHWYRIDLLLVNELGLFRRADIEPNGQVILTCDLHTPSHDSITPFSYDDPDWQIDIRACRSFAEGKLSPEPLAVPGFASSGKGAFEYRITSKRANTTISNNQKKFLHIRPTRLVNFPKQQQEQENLDIILPLVIGPIEIVSETSVKDTALPLELWQEQDMSMVYDGYRLFSTSDNPPVNIAIHEMWDSGIPGKIWDSALVMLDVIKNMIDQHPEYIHQKHTLDLSAG
jgi:hypothetical protein